MTRKDITVGNRVAPDGTVHDTWDTLFYIVDTLTIAGMSSDESDTNESNRPIYRVKRRAWRSKALTRYLILVDHDQNKTNAYGNIRSGNPPRTRVRHSNNALSVRDPPTNLPINFYNEDWYSGLTNKQKRDLAAKDAVELPEVVEAD